MTMAFIFLSETSYTTFIKTAAFEKTASLYKCESAAETYYHASIQLWRKGTKTYLAGLVLSSTTISLLHEQRKRTNIHHRCGLILGLPNQHITKNTSEPFILI